MLILDKIIETGATAYHFEESKKGFTVDIYKIREKLREKACMFIPFDAISLLQSGDLKAIEREVNDIVYNTAMGGGMVLSTGCPVMNDIPEESIDTMIKTARRAGRLRSYLATSTRKACQFFWTWPIEIVADTSSDFSTSIGVGSSTAGFVCGLLSRISFGSAKGSGSGTGLSG